MLASTYMNLHLIITLRCASGVTATVVSGPVCLSVTSKVFERDETQVQSLSALDCDLTGGVRTSSAGLSLMVGDGK